MGQKDIGIYREKIFRLHNLHKEGIICGKIV